MYESEIDEDINPLVICELLSHNSQEPLIQLSVPYILCGKAFVGYYEGSIGITYIFLIEASRRDLSCFLLLVIGKYI